MEIKRTLAALEAVEKAVRRLVFRAITNTDAETHTCGCTKRCMGNNHYRESALGSGFQQPRVEIAASR